MNVYSGKRKFPYIFNLRRSEWLVSRFGRFILNERARGVYLKKVGCAQSSSGEGNKKFWEELIAHFLSIRQGPHRKRRLQQFFYPLPQERVYRAVA
jgi:hypothetical protein